LIGLVSTTGIPLTLARDYIGNGIRARAENLVTLEIGSRNDPEIRRDLDAQIEADRWTKLDRVLSAEAGRSGGVVDLRASDREFEPLEARLAKIGRMQKLERLGLAESTGPAQWELSDVAEATLRALGGRHDIIKRIHRGLKEQGIERSPTEYSIDSGGGQPILARLVSRGLDDELAKSAYAIIDATDGRRNTPAWPTWKRPATPHPAPS
jgi:type IV secretory pathway VirD2 relaxase